jgi:2-enoate reductase
LVLATGAEPLRPTIAGVEGENVTTAEAVLRGQADVGRRVVVAGGGRLGLEMALFLAHEGSKVSLVEMQGEVGADMEACERTYLLQRLDEQEVSILTNRSIRSIDERGAEVVDREWNSAILACDTVVLALGATPNVGLSQQVQGSVAEVYVIGDCVEPRRIYEAIHEAWWVATRI